MITQTTMDAWLKLQASNKINENQLIILDVFKNANGMALSNYDISTILEWPINRVTPRVNELLKKGKLVRVWRKVQLQTGRSVFVSMRPEDVQSNIYIDIDRINNLEE